jgi:hypothetical protein
VRVLAVFGHSGGLTGRLQPLIMFKAQSPRLVSNHRTAVGWRVASQPPQSTVMAAPREVALNGRGGTLMSNDPAERC